MIIKRGPALNIFLFYIFFEENYTLTAMMMLSSSDSRDENPEIWSIYKEVEKMQMK